MAGLCKNIIFISYLPLTRRIVENFYIDLLSQENFSVEYWDIGNIYFNHLNIKAEDVALENKYVNKVNSIKLFEKLVVKKNRKETVFIPLVTYEARVLKIFRILSKHDCRTAFFARGFLPIGSKNYGLSELIGKIKKIFISKKIISAILNKKADLYRKLKIIKPYNFVFCAGQEAKNMYSDVSKIVNVNYFDYDAYLIKKNEINMRVIDSKYCVFIDDNLIQSLDFKIIGIRTPTPKSYYESLNRFFGLIEKKFNLKVLIAVHPNSNYKNSEFKERLCYKNMTNELVKNCEFVLTSYSSSISYAVCYKKTIFFIYNDEMKKLNYINYIYSYINNISKYLDSKMYNIDDINAVNELFFDGINEERYSMYKYEYLTSKESENQLSREIILKYFKHLNDTGAL